MSRRRELERAVAEAEAAAGRPSFLRIVAEVLIHEQSEDGQVCACCRSRHAAIVERRPIADLVIDLDTGRRIYEADVAADVWSELVAVAERRDVPMRLSRPQAALVLDESPRHLFASGGNRSSKTTAALIWMALQWLRRGGPERRFWMVASTLPKAFRLLEKLLRGTGESPPILPIELIARAPATPRASDMQTILVDGSVVDLRYFEGDPGAERLKSDAIVAAVVDEAAHLPTPDSLVALRGRCLDAGGRLFFATTPRPSSFLKTDVVEPAIAFDRLPADDERRASGKHEGARWCYVELPLLENPWLPRKDVEMELKALDPAAPAVQRDFFGKWTSGCGFLWSDFSVQRHVLVHEARDFAGLGAIARAQAGAPDHVDVTARAVSIVFGSPSLHFRKMRAPNNRYVLGLDVNCHPLTAIVLQVSAPNDPKAIDDREQWHFWIFECIQTFEGNSYAHAEKLAATAFGRMLEPTASSSPLKGCGIVADGTSLARDPTAHRFGGDPLGLAEVFGRQGFDVRAPVYTEHESSPPKARNPNRKDSHLLMHRLLREGRFHVSQRCEALIESFLNQEDSGDGVEPQTVSATKSDRLASPMDATRYPIWAITHAPAPVRMSGSTFRR